MRLHIQKYREIYRYAHVDIQSNYKQYLRNFILMILVMNESLSILNNQPNRLLYFGYKEWIEAITILRQISSVRETLAIG